VFCLRLILVWSQKNAMFDPSPLSIGTMVPAMFRPGKRLRTRPASEAWWL
jgi:hypothetical protein